MGMVQLMSWSSMPEAAHNERSVNKCKRDVRAARTDYIDVVQDQANVLTDVVATVSLVPDFNAKISMHDGKAFLRQGRCRPGDEGLWLGWVMEAGSLEGACH